jgi:hypothetical protein
MAQTPTVLGSPANTSQGGIPPGVLKLGCLNIANGAGETSIAVDWATYGFSTVIVYGLTRRDTYTAGIDFSNLSGTTVTYTWTANDVANVLVWALGH